MKNDTSFAAVGDTRRRNRVGAVVLWAVLAIGAGCGDPAEPEGIAGSYTATTFIETRSGQAPINILAAGGSMSMVIAADNSTTGTLNVPASVTGGAALVASMNGTAVLTADTVRFEQNVNTFVRRAYWLVVGSNTIRYDQTADGSNLVVVLTR